MSIKGNPLGRREQQVLEMIADGHETPAIAAALFVSPSTVKTYRRKLYEKLGARTAANAVRLAYERGDLRTATSEAAASPDELAVVKSAHEMGYRIALVPLAGGPVAVQAALGGAR